MRALALALIAALGCNHKKPEPGPEPDAAPARPRVSRPIPPEAIPRPERPRVRLADLESPDDKTRLAAVRAIAKNPPRAPAAIARMLELLGSKKPELRLTAATALTYVEAPETTAPLIAAMKDRDPLVAHQALMALARRRDPAALPGVLATLDSGDVKRRTWAVGAIGKLGDPARPHWKKLLPRLSDEVIGVRLQAVRAIGRLGDAAAVAPLVAAAKHHGGLIAIQVRLALGDLAIDDATREKALAEIPKSSPVVH